MLHYDSDKYDIFWKTVQDLDIPVYMHPRLASPTIQKQLWEGRPGWGPQVFSTGVSIHTLGLCGNGVFDRFPEVQFVIGHLGEGLPADIWRLDHCTKPQFFNAWCLTSLRATERHARPRKMQRVVALLLQKQHPCYDFRSLQRRNLETMYERVHTPYLILSNIVGWVLIESSIVLIRPMSGAQRVPNGGMKSIFLPKTS